MKCIKCSIEKELNSFYRHKGMSNGYLNKCIECCKKESVERYYILKKNPDFLEKERERVKERYRRLNYKDKQKEWDKNRSWKNTSKYKNLSKKFKTSKGIEIHHWNYNDEFLEDVFILKISEHRRAHRFLSFDEEKKVFKNLLGEILDTKDKHKEYLLSIGIKFNT